MVENSAETLETAETKAVKSIKFDSLVTSLHPEQVGVSGPLRKQFNGA